MKHKAQVYIAVDPEDQVIAGVLKAYLDDRGFRCVWRSTEREQRDLVHEMERCDVIVLIDSETFRMQADNWELQFAQELSRPLVVVSLHQAVDERRSTSRVRLFDFTHPMKRRWQRVLETVCTMAQPAIQQPAHDFLL